MGSIVAEHKRIGGNQRRASAHVLVIPLSSQGHIAPLPRLAGQLARHGITITVVSFEDAISRLRASGNGPCSDLQSLNFHFVALHKSEDRHKQSGWRNVSRRYSEAFEPVLEKLIHAKNTGISGGPTCIISDVFLPWTQDVADKLQIPRYVFVTSGVIFARLLQGFLEYCENGRFEFSETDGKLVEFDWSVCIAGLPPLRYHELPRGVQDDPEAFKRMSESMVQSAGILVNSFIELEERVIENWRSTGQPDFKVSKIYPVGPLFAPSAALPNFTVARRLEDSASKCIQWLDSQPCSSVLYVAFGSQAHLRSEQIKELAHGLKGSKLRFLWVIPESKVSSKDGSPSVIELLPSGFEARVGDLGCVVTGWTPQVQILAHSATGGFLTHSGWNSTLESVIFGVPMIAWPQGAEQHLNCRYLVDHLKIAEQLQTGPENDLKHSEVERVVRLLMIEPEGREIRTRVKELKRKAATAMAEGGSQSRILTNYLDDIRNHGCLQIRE